MASIAKIVTHARCHKERSMEVEPTVIYTASSAEVADLLKNVLAENGIDAQVTAATWAGTGALLARAQVSVAEPDVAEARRIAAEFEHRAHTDTAEEAEPAAGAAAPGVWPTCPSCGTRRTAICPACRTQGTDFPAADRAPDSDAAGATAAEALPALLLCPECDEPFAPGYLHCCAQCGYEFEAAEDDEEDETGALREHLSAWVWVVALISVLLIVLVIGLLFLAR